MSIADKIESIENHLKDDYNSLEKLGVSVEDRNIENIKELAELIYKKFPKTDYAEGTEITLENTLKGKIDYEDDIVGYGDIKQESYEGYNLLPNSRSATRTVTGITYTNNGDGTFTLNGTATNYTQILDSDTFELPSGTYTLQSPNIDAYTTLQLRSEDGTITYGNTNSSTSKLYGTFTLAETTILKLRVTIQSDRVINNMLVKPMVYSGNYDSTKDYEPYVGGTASPNPDYPQEIEVVRGKNRLPNNGTSKTISGITFTVNEDKSITANGTATATIVWNLLNDKTSGDMTASDINLSKGTYTLSGCPSGGSSSTYKIDVNQRSGAVFTDYGNGETKTLSADTPIQLFRIVIYSGATLNNLVFKPMLEKGSQATSYLPYNTLEVSVRGTNKFDISQLEIGKAWNNASARDKAVCYFNFNEGDMFTISTTGISTFDQSLVRCIFKANKESTSNLGTYEISATRTLTAPTGAGIACIQFNKDNISLSDFEGVEIMINEGDTALPYEPYITPVTKQLSLGEYEFAKIGNYVDTIEYDVENDKVYKNGNIGKVVFSNTDVFNADTGGQRVTYDALKNIIKIPQSNANAFIGLCNMLQVRSFNNIYNNKYMGVACSTGGTLSFHIDNITDKSTGTEIINALSNLMATQSIILYYALAETIREEITGTLADQVKALYNTQSNTGTTIITVDGDLPMIMKVRALKGE